MSAAKLYRWTTINLDQYLTEVLSQFIKACYLGLVKPLGPSTPLAARLKWLQSHGGETDGVTGPVIERPGATRLAERRGTATDSGGLACLCGSI